MALFQQEKGLIVSRGQVQITENALRRIGLKCPELEPPIWTMGDREVHPAIAPVADAVEENQPFVLGPFMYGRIKLVVHWTVWPSVCLSLPKTLSQRNPAVPAINEAIRMASLAALVVAGSLGNARLFQVSCVSA